MTVTLHWWMLAVAIPVIGGIAAYVVGSKPHGDYDFGGQLMALFIFVGSVVGGVCIVIGHYIS